MEQCYCVVLHAILDDTSEQPAEEAYADLGALAARLSSHKMAEPSGHSNSSSPDPGVPSTAAGLAAAAAAHARSAAGSPAPGESEPQQQQQQQQPPSALSMAVGGGDDSMDGSPVAWKIGTRKRTLFAGYVSFRQILDFINNSRSGNLLEAILGGSGAQTDKVVMTGPGGTGRAEVAVTKLMGQVRPGSRGASSTGNGSVGGNMGGMGRRGGSSSSHGGLAADKATDGKQLLGGGGAEGSLVDEPGSSSEQEDSGSVQSVKSRGSLLERGLFRARQVATGIQKAVAEMNSTGSLASLGQSQCSMQCSLMLLRLPVRYIAREVLEAV